MEHQHSHHEKHHILPEGIAIRTGVTLLILTAITVGVAHIDLGKMNTVVALVVATIKAFLVCSFFMGLKYDKRENTLIFLTSFLFLMVFITLTSFDLFFRGDVYVKKGQGMAAVAGGPLKFKRPWVATPELLAHGKELFNAQCVTCHGAEGKGNGPASAALDPKPRNFTSGDGWKAGRKATQIYTTVTKGLGKMPSFGALPADDRFALVHYVTSFGPKAPEINNEDLKGAGIDPSKEDGGLGGGPRTLPIDVAIELMAVPEQK